MEPGQTVADFDRLQQPETIVEHMTASGFLARIPHRWHMDDVRRFGTEVGRIAEALHIAYITTTDIALGIVRVFPVPLLRRVYTIQSASFGWPSLTAVQTPALGEDLQRAARDTLRSHTSLLKHLRTLLAALETTGSHEVAESTATTIHWLEQDSTRLRAELGEESPAGSGE